MICGISYPLANGVGTQPADVTAAKDGGHSAVVEKNVFQQFVFKTHELNALVHLTIRSSGVNQSMFIKLLLRI